MINIIPYHIPYQPSTSNICVSGYTGYNTKSKAIFSMYTIFFSIHRSHIIPDFVYKNIPGIIGGNIIKEDNKNDQLGNTYTNNNHLNNSDAIPF